MAKAKTADEYLEQLPDDRRQSMQKVLETVRASLPPGYQESMSWGMITWEIPLERYPETYNKQPLGYAALASQKNYMSLYLMAVYADSEQEKWLREQFAKSGKKLDIGKSCLRFRSADDLPLDVIGQLIASTPPETFIERYEKSREKGAK
jgi:uncharacterized protein YdhG (YjbR/CyaY superfamily)